MEQKNKMSEIKSFVDQMLWPAEGQSNIYEPLYYLVTEWQLLGSYKKKAENFESHEPEVIIKKKSIEDKFVRKIKYL